MEKNTVLIDLEKYEKLIIDIENLKKEIKDLEHKYLDASTDNVLVKDKITKDIYKEFKWQLGQITKNKDEDNSYYKRQISDKFKDYGFISQDYINSQIEIMLITKDIYKEFKWQLGQITKNKDEDNSYYKRQISDKFKDYGFISQDYINSQIEIMLERYEEEKGEKE